MTFGKKLGLKKIKIFTGLDSTFIFDGQSKILNLTF